MKKWGGWLFLVSALGAQAGPQSVSQHIDRIVQTLPGVGAPHAAALADDAEFLRRVMLDLVGSTPNAGETASFLAEAGADKRARKIDDLLASPRFADFWSRRFAEVYFGNYHQPAFDVSPGLKSETKTRILLNFIAWLKEALQSDRPWTEVVSDMIVARGNTAAVPELGYKISFYRDDRQEIQFATGVSRHHLGIALQCARCHDYPYDKWRVEEFHGLAAFNTRQRARRVVQGPEEQVEISYVTQGEWDLDDEKPRDPTPRDVKIGRGGSASAQLLGELGEQKGERIRSLAELMLKDKNKRLARALTGRVWAWLIGRGLTEPVDDVNVRNKPVSEPLLSLLVGAFEEGKGSIRSLIRVIAVSETYQRSSEVEGKCDRRDFCRGYVLPLSGEQLLNAIQVATKGSAGFDPKEALQLTAALTPRPQVGCEVQPLPYGPLHALLLRNSEQIWDWIRNGGVLKEIRRQARTDDEVVEQMFVAALSRRPGPSERGRYIDFIKDRGDNGVADAYWSLINSAEFLTRH